MTDDVHEIRVQLENITEQLADLAMAVLRDAVEAGADKRPAAEKTLTRARRAVEKAVHILDSDGPETTSR